MMNCSSQFHESNPLDGNHSITSLQSSHSLPFQNSPSISRNSYNSMTDSVYPTLSTGSLNIQSKEFFPSSETNTIFLNLLNLKDKYPETISKNNNIIIGTTVSKTESL